MEFFGNAACPVTTLVFPEDDANQWQKFFVTLFMLSLLALLPRIKRGPTHPQYVTNVCDGRRVAGDGFNGRIDVGYSLRPKMANGQVARDDCSPRAPTDPYVPTLEHTAPHIRRSPRDCGRPSAQHAVAEAGTIRAAD